MTLIAKEDPRISNVVKRETWPDQGYCRLAVTANEAAAVDYVPGTVLGKVTATGKYAQYNNAATDGSEVAAAVCIEKVSVPATTDTTVLCIVKGPAILADGGLVFQGSQAAADKTAAYADLEALNINVDSQV